MKLQMLGMLTVRAKANLKWLETIFSTAPTTGLDE